MENKNKNNFENFRGQLIKNQNNLSFIEKHFDKKNFDLYKVKEDGSYEYIMSFEGETNNGRDVSDKAENY